MEEALHVASCEEVEDQIEKSAKGCWVGGMLKGDRFAPKGRAPAPSSAEYAVEYGMNRLLEMLGTDAAFGRHKDEMWDPFSPPK